MFMRLYSDIHNEMRRPRPMKTFKCPERQERMMFQWQPKELPTDKDTVLILAGDIDSAKQLPKFLNIMARRFKYVIAVPGNHEYYGFRVDKAQKYMKEGLADNAFVLLNETLTLEGHKFVGSTMWGDIPKNITTMAACEWGMNDYKWIDVGSYGKKMKVSDTQLFHEEAMEFLDEEVTEGSIVITHHMPIPPARGIVHDLDYAYCAQLQHFIQGHKPAMWLYDIHTNHGKT